MERTMTGRERMLATLRRQRADRVPVSTYEMTAFGPWSWYVNEPSYARVMAAIEKYAVELPLWGPPGLPSSNPPPTTTETWQEGEFNVHRTTITTPKGDLTTVSKETPSVKTTWTVEHLCKTVDDAERYLSLPECDGGVDVSEFAKLDAAVGDRGIVLCDTGDAFGCVAPLFEFGEFTVLVLTEPAIVRRLCDRAHAQILRNLETMLKAGCGPLYRIWGPEYATPPYLPPKAFREFVQPYLREMIALIHSYGCYARVHSHGKTAHVLDMIVDAGADAIDPVEPPPDGDISMLEVKLLYGDRLVLFGNMELKYLEQETPKEIDARVLSMMDEAKGDGGFVLLPTATPINIPLAPKTEENLIAYLEAGWKYGAY